VLGSKKNLTFLSGEIVLVLIGHYQQSLSTITVTEISNEGFSDLTYKIINVLRSTGGPRYMQTFYLRLCVYAI